MNYIYRNIILSTCILFSISHQSFSQSTDKLKGKEIKILEYEGDKAINQSNFLKGHENFTKLVQNDPENRLFIYKQAICKTRLDNEKEQGLSTLLTYEADLEQEEYQDVLFFIAEGYYNLHQFNKAQEYYQKYYIQIKDITPSEWVRDIQLKIDYAYNANEICNDSIADLEITNIGDSINSKYFEYSPYVTPQEDMIVYTYMGVNSVGGKTDERFRPSSEGTYGEDIYISYKNEQGVWKKAKPLNEINSIYNESCVGISPSGDRLFVFKSENGNPGDLYETYIDGAGNWTDLSRLEGDVNSEYWEGSATITQDGKTLYFSSTRPGGFGGRDIYSAKLQEDGTWGDVKNLGPEINSENDEDSPFIHPDKKTLFYSTNGIKSIGGYDIVKAELEGGNWSFKGNLGVPINTLGNDRFYVLSADGKTAYFSRESTSGAGDQDIFVIKPGQVSDQPVLTVISGFVYLNDELVDANLQVFKIADDELQGNYRTAHYSKKYTLLLEPQNNYYIDIIINNEKVRTDTLNSEFVDSYIQINHDFYIYTDDYQGDRLAENSLQKDVQKEYNSSLPLEEETQSAASHDIVTAGNDTITMHQMNEIIKQNRIDFYRNNPDLAAEEGITPELLDLADSLALTDNVEYSRDNGFEPTSHNSPNDILADTSIHISEEEKVKLNTVFHPTFGADELVYRIQVAAYRKPENFVWGEKGTYGDVLEVTYDDGITRFTIGGTTHLKEAIALQKKLVQSGIIDAFVVAFKGDERIPLYELNKR